MQPKYVSKNSYKEINAGILVILELEMSVTILRADPYYVVLKTGSSSTQKLPFLPKDR